MLHLPVRLAIPARCHPGISRPQAYYYCYYIIMFFKPVLEYLPVHLSHKTFKTMVICQFFFAAGHKLFGSIERQSPFADFYEFPMLW